MTTTDLDAHRLYMIASGAALAAEVENDLEERGLIVQTDKPYATLTDAGKALIAPLCTYEHGPESGVFRGSR